MLPFLKPRSMSTVIIARHGKADLDAHPEMDAPDASSNDKEDMHPDFKEAAEDVMRAFDRRSVTDLARALHSAFELFDAAPHVEGEHEDEEELGD